MKAVVCKEYGPPESLVIGELPDPVPGPGEVLVAVKAASVNFPDVLIIENKYQFKPKLPFAPGTEAAGVIEAVGEGVTDLKPGMRVLAGTGHGGMAQKAVAPASKVCRIPDKMDFNTAASFLTTYGTSHYALKDRAHIQPGESLLVLGAAGGVGLAAVELGKAMGARVIAAASSEDKVKTALDHGADVGFVYPAGRLDRDQQKALSEKIKELTGGKGADVVYDPVGGDYSEPALRATNWEGRFLVIGFAAGEIPKIPLNLTLLKGCNILGVFWGANADRDPEGHKANVRELMDLYEAGKLKPLVSAVYPMERAAQAMRDLADRKAKGKLVITIDG